MDFMMLLNPDFVYELMAIVSAAVGAGVIAYRRGKLAAYIRRDTEAASDKVC